MDKNGELPIPKLENETITNMALDPKSIYTKEVDLPFDQLAPCSACQLDYRELFIPAFSRYIAFTRDTDKYAIQNLSHQIRLGIKHLHNLTHH